MTDRDTFAAAALAGLIANGDYSVESTPLLAYRMADAMLARRKPPTKPSGVAEAYATAKQISDAQDFVRYREEFKAWKTCRAGGKASGDMDRTDKAAPRPDAGTGNTIDVEELIAELRELGASKVSGDIRDTCRDAASAIERLRTWVNELQLSRAEIDAIQHVVEDGRFVDLGDYGRLRSLLVRMRPEWEDEPDRPQPVKDDVSDRSKPISDDRLAALEQLSALDQELELKHGITGNPMIKARHNNESM